MKNKINILSPIDFSFKLLAILMFCLFVQVSVFSQNTQLTEDINVYTGFEPRLAEVEKLSFQPTIQDTFRVVTNLEYPIQSSTVETKYQPDTISALRMKTEPLNKLHRLYIKAGFGNYLTPYADINFMSLRNRKNSYALRFKHFSSQGNISYRGNPAVSDNEIYGSYSHMFRSQTLDLNASYLRNVVRYYNYNPVLDTLVSEDTARQRYSRVNFDASLYSTHRTDSIKFNHKIDLNFYHMTDRWGTMENSVVLSADLNKFTDLFAREFFGGKMRFQYIQYQNDSITSNHGFIGNLTPYMRFGGNWWNLHLGVDLTLGTDDSTRFNVYPDVHLRFNIFRNYIIAYGSFTGQYRRNSFLNLSLQNPFILPTARITNINEFLRITGGVKGSFTSNLSYNAGVHYSIIGNYAYFVNDTISFHQRGFQVVYDQTNLFQVFGELSYNMSEKFWLAAKANYYLYNTTNLDVAWHRPSVDATLSGYYNLRDKIILRTDFYFIGPQKAQTFVYDPANPLIKERYVYEIPILVDFNIGAEYRLTKMLSFWVNFNNVAAWRYQRWYGFPTQQFNVIGGLTFGI
ncbi:MAG: hypothetical protein N2167_06650 [Flavobacteriales bacterium]|nr:hypothetical protein [Flavobacteriales bacterium]